jgi:hypothetical protein
MTELNLRFVRCVFLHYVQEILVETIVCREFWMKGRRYQIS